MVGGVVIEVKRMVGAQTADDSDVWRLWVMDGDDECCVYFPVPPGVEGARTIARMPAVGERIWWQGRQIFYHGDTETLHRIGFAHRPDERQFNEIA